MSFPRRVGRGGEAGAVAEEATEVGGVGKAQVGGDGAGCPAATAEQAAGFEEAALVDHLPCSGAVGGPGGSGEGADRAAEQAGVVVDVVQLAEVQFQCVEEAPVDRGAPTARAVSGGGAVSGRWARRSSRDSSRLRRSA